MPRGGDQPALRAFIVFKSHLNDVTTGHLGNATSAEQYLLLADTLAGAGDPGISVGAVGSRLGVPSVGGGHGTDDKHCHPVVRKRAPAHHIGKHHVGAGATFE